MEVNSPTAKKWLNFSANNLKQKFWDEQWKDYYEKKKKEYEGQMEDIIEKDVSRSCYSMEKYPRYQKMIRRELSDLLHAYCVYDPELGYTQGMNYIVERLLAHLTDFQAFIVWIGILKTDDFRSFYTDNFGDRLQSRFQEIIIDDLRIKFPEIDRQVKKLMKVNDSAIGCSQTESDPLFIFYALYTQIAMTLGCVLPISTEVKDRIITEFLQDRDKTYTTGTILFGVFYVLEKDIMTCRSIENLYQLLSSDSLNMTLKDQDVLEYGKVVRKEYPLLRCFDIDEPGPTMDSDDSSEFWII